MNVFSIFLLSVTIFTLSAEAREPIVLPTQAPYKNSIDDHLFTFDKKSIESNKKKSPTKISPVINIQDNDHQHINNTKESEENSKTNTTAKEEVDSAECKYTFSFKKPASLHIPCINPNRKTYRCQIPIQHCVSERKRQTDIFTQLSDIIIGANLASTNSDIPIQVETIYKYFFQNKLTISSTQTSHTGINQQKISNNQVILSKYYSNKTIPQHDNYNLNRRDTNESGNELIPALTLHMLWKILSKKNYRSAAYLSKKKGEQAISEYHTLSSIPGVLSCPNPNQTKEKEESYSKKTDNSQNGKNGIGSTEPHDQSSSKKENNNYRRGEEEGNEEPVPHIHLEDGFSCPACNFEPCHCLLCCDSYIYNAACSQTSEENDLKIAQLHQSMELILLDLSNYDEKTRKHELSSLINNHEIITKLVRLLPPGFTESVINRSTITDDHLREEHNKMWLSLLLNAAKTTIKIPDNNLKTIKHVYNKNVTFTDFMTAIFPHNNRSNDDYMNNTMRLLLSRYFNHSLAVFWQSRAHGFEKEPLTAADFNYIMKEIFELHGFIYKPFDRNQNTGSNIHPWVVPRRGSTEPEWLWSEGISINFNDDSYSTDHLNNVPPGSYLFHNADENFTSPVVKVRFDPANNTNTFTLYLLGLGALLTFNNSDEFFEFCIYNVDVKLTKLNINKKFLNINPINEDNSRILLDLETLQLFDRIDINKLHLPTHKLKEHIKDKITTGDVKRSYKALSRVFHPDKTGNSDTTEFIKITGAVERLEGIIKNQQPPSPK